VVKKIGTLYLKSLTPCSLGWYDTKLHDKLFRVSELRALAEWWLRALATGFLEGNEDDILKAQGSIFGSTNESSLITFKVANLNTDSTRAAENLISTIYPGAHVADNKLKIAAQVAWHPRLQLIFMKELGSLRKQLKSQPIKELGSVGSLDTSALKSLKVQLQKFAKRILKNPLEKMFCYIDATVDIYVNAIDLNGVYTHIIAGLYSLILGLTFEGLGKGSRRGFGAFFFNMNLEDLKKNITTDRREDIERLEGLTRLLNSYKDLDDCLTLLDEVIKNAREAVKEFIESIGLKAKTLKYSEENLPNLPALAPGTVDIFAIQRPVQKAALSDPLLEDITYLSNMLFLRTTFHPVVVNDLATKNLPTLPQYLQGIPAIRGSRQARSIGSYIEGLPRKGSGSGKNIAKINIFGGNLKWLQQKGRFTGYEFVGKYTRRKSPLILSPLNENVLLITLIKSTDFPEELLWSTTGPRRAMTVRTLPSAYREVVNEINKILSSLGTSFQHLKI